MMPKKKESEKPKNKAAQELSMLRMIRMSSARRREISLHANKVRWDRWREEQKNKEDKNETENE